MDSITGVVLLGIFLVLGIAFIRVLDPTLRRRLRERRAAIVEGLSASGDPARKERLLYEPIKEDNGIVIWSPLLIGVSILALTLLATLAGNPRAELSTGTLLLGIALILLSTIVVPLLVFYSELNGRVVVYELTEEAIVRRDLKLGRELNTLSFPWGRLDVSIVEEGGQDPDRFMVELLLPEGQGTRTVGTNRRGKRMYLYTGLVNFLKFCELAIEKMPPSSFKGRALELLSGYMRRGGSASAPPGH